MSHGAKFSFLSILFVVFFLFQTASFQVIAEKKESNFKPLPHEDQQLGRNSHVYQPSLNVQTKAEKQEFIDKIAKVAMEANLKTGIPASAIIGMAILESGYGTTRIAHYANNFFGIKRWAGNSSNAWQLKGQPDSEFEGEIPVLANYGEDRLVFDETVRVDNWYRIFSSKTDAVDYLTGTLLLNSRYVFARDNFLARLEQGWSYQAATELYIYDIADAGYNHRGGEYYQQAVGKIIEQWHLSQYDIAAERVFADVPNDSIGYDAIMYLQEQGIIAGYDDGTFQPKGDVTRAEAAKMFVLTLAIEEVLNKASFTDMSDHWGEEDILTLAATNIIEGFPDGTFRPDKNVTRAEIAKMLVEAYNYEATNDVGAPSFKDVNQSSWYYEYVNALVTHGVTFGTSETEFAPNHPVTREQIALFIYRSEEWGRD